MYVTLKNKDIDVGLVLIKPFIQREIPIKVSFAIAKTSKRLRDIVELIMEERKKLIIKHQATDNDGNRIEKENGNIKLISPANFSDDFDELMRQETEVDVHQINYEELMKMKDGNGKSMQPSPSELEGLLLLQMIKEEKEIGSDESD